MKKFVTVCLAIAVLGFALSAVSLVRDPYASARAELRDRLREEPLQPDLSSENVEYDHAINTIMSRPSLWEELIAPPPPPPPPPPKPTPPPNLEAMLRGVVPTRQQIGERVRIKTASDPSGDFYGVGDTVQGCTIKEVSRRSVVFAAYDKDGREYTRELARE